MSSNELTDSGNHGTARPWVGPDGDVHECNVVEQYGDALAAAMERCYRYPAQLQRARLEDERNPRPRGLSRVEEVRIAFARFIRVTIGANTIAVAALGELPARPVNGGKP